MPTVNLVEAGGNNHGYARIVEEFAGDLDLLAGGTPQAAAATGDDDDNYGQWRGYLRFTGVTLKPSDTITSATLKLYDRETRATSSNGISVHSIFQKTHSIPTTYTEVKDWVLTAALAHDARESQTADTEVSLDVTQVIQEAISHPEYDGSAIMIVLEMHERENGSYFAQRHLVHDGDNASGALRPQLDITYTSGSGATAPGTVTTFTAASGDAGFTSGGNFSTSILEFGSNPGDDDDAAMLYDSAIRFTGVNIPAGATIDSAVLVLRMNTQVPRGCGADVTCELATNPAFPTNRTDFNGRSRTTATTTFRADYDGGLANHFPRAEYNSTERLFAHINVVGPLQELVNDAGYSSGNAVQFLLDGAGNQTETIASNFSRYETADSTGSPVAPELRVTYNNSTGPAEGEIIRRRKRVTLTLTGGGSL